MPIKAEKWKSHQILTQEIPREGHNIGSTSLWQWERGGVETMLGHKVISNKAGTMAHNLAFVRSACIVHISSGVENITIENYTFMHEPSYPNDSVENDDLNVLDSQRWSMRHHDEKKPITTPKKIKWYLKVWQKRPNYIVYYNFY